MENDENTHTHTFFWSKFNLYYKYFYFIVLRKQQSNEYNLYSMHEKSINTYRNTYINEYINYKYKSKKKHTKSRWKNSYKSAYLPKNKRKIRNPTELKHFNRFKSNTFWIEFVFHVWFIWTLQFRWRLKTDLHFT